VSNGPTPCAPASLAIEECGSDSQALAKRVDGLCLIRTGRRQEWRRGTGWGHELLRASQRCTESMPGSVVGGAWAAVAIGAPRPPEYHGRGWGRSIGGGCLLEAKQKERAEVCDYWTGGNGADILDTCGGFGPCRTILLGGYFVKHHLIKSASRPLYDYEDIFPR
jgi:hypothetical protein